MQKHAKNLLTEIIKNNSKLAEGIVLKYEEERVFITNSTLESKTINITKLLFFRIKNKFLKFENEGVLEKGECYFSILDTRVPLNSMVDLDLYKINYQYYNITLTLKPDTKLILNKLLYCVEAIKTLENPEIISSSADTLIISPGYPSSSNLYAFGFVHTSAKGYAKSGFGIDVFCPNDNKIKYQYLFDNSKIICQDLVFLKNLIHNSNYKRIIIHFFDEKFAAIVESVALYYGIKIYVYVHGADVLYRYQEKMVTGYDGVYHPCFNAHQIQIKDLILKKYSQSKNFTWIFVSNWLKEEAEKIIETKFLNSFVIPNGLDIEIFKYHKKLPEARLNIFTIRRFDNINKYGIDLIVNTILYLSNQHFFKYLNFNIYGDGPLFKEFANKVKDFPNVKLIRGFYTHQQISELHKNHGIIFHPTRLDAMGCSSLEGVCAGLVLISSNICAIPEFIDPAYGTLSSDVENPASYAAIIEDLYNNPDKFLRLSEQMSKDISSQYARSIILEKELELIKNEKPFYIAPTAYPTTEISEKILTICIPAYNIEKYLVRALNSILSCSKKNLLDIIIINDGSTDSTLNVARQYEKDFPDIITIIDQENGGHGAAIMAGITNATAKYFKIIDGDDWVAPDSLDKLLTSMQYFDVDLILTEFSYDKLESRELSKCRLYAHLPNNTIFPLEKATFPFHFGPVLAASTYKTSILKSSNLKIEKKCFYVDMEFNAYSLKNVKNILYLDIFLYKYFIGRAAQSTSMKTYRARYNDHAKVIFNILDFLENDRQLNDYKRKLIVKKLLQPMLVTHFTNFVRFKMYHEAFKMYKKIAKYKDIPINMLIIKTITLFLISPIIRLGDKLLLAPYNFGKYTLYIMNKHDIRYFNEYAAIIGKIFLLPRAIAHKTYRSILFFFKN